MAVETFFLFGFRAFSDVIKEIFPPGEDNAIAKIIKKLEANEIKADDFLKVLEKALIKFKDIAFEEKNLRFHLLKQLEPAYGHKAIIKMEPIQPIAMALNKTPDIFEITWATADDLKECPSIIFPLELFKGFLIEDLDVLKLITEDKIDIEKFDELNEFIVRALLGFTSAFFLKDEFQKRAKKGLIEFMNSVLTGGG
jgi:hypothetical protein